MIETIFTAIFIIMNSSFALGIYLLFIGEKKRQAILGKIKCKLGWHEWTYNLGRGQALSLTSKPPKHATCSRCGIKYSK